MEYIESILYHKIMDSDFTNMYGTKKPNSGGGQTYIQAAGYNQEEIDKMFADAHDVYNTPEYWDKDGKYPRKNYTIDAYEVGTNEHDNIELSPRTGRKDYRICRQNLKYRHPAWKYQHGFPKPHSHYENNKVVFEYEKGYPGLIDCLYILIIKTKTIEGKSKYYATYVDSEEYPSQWPTGAGLEDIFSKSKKQGILFFTEQFLRFSNNKAHPFQVGSAIDTVIGNIDLPNELNEQTDDAVEYVKKNISVTIDYEKIEVIKSTPPKKKRKAVQSAKVSAGKDINYERRLKNLKKIGDIGEELAIRIEKERLINEGQQELAEKIEWVSKTIGDGLGYDIKSYEKKNDIYIEKYIEVKSTTGSKNKPFDISANEVRISKELQNQYYIFRFYGIGNQTNNVGYYIIQGDVEDNCTLEPTSFKAYYKN